LPSIKEILKTSSQKLKGMEQSPYKVASILLAESLHVETLWLLTHEDEVIEAPIEFLDNIKKAQEFCPIEYLLKKCSFYSRDFYVDERVLIPRPETELLIDEVIRFCKDLKEPTIAEIGTGSGIISILLAQLLPKAKIIATDISKDALEVAKINAKKHGVQERIEFVNCNLLDKVEEKIDILVSNPPYIKRGEVLEKNLSYEPNLALFAGVLGDEILKDIIDISIKKKVRYLACEMGYDQKDKIINYLKKHNMKVKFYKDLAGLDRGFILPLNPSDFA